MTLRERFPELHTFFGGWFHQDWPIEGEDDVAVIKAFSDEVGPETVEAVRGELARFLQLGLDEEAMQHAIWEDFACGYYPMGSGQSMTVWVRSVRDRLEELSP
jgi:hypothetical protein